MPHVLTDPLLDAWRRRAAARLIRAVAELRGALEELSRADDAMRREQGEDRPPLALTLGAETAPLEVWARHCDTWIGTNTIDC